MAVVNGNQKSTAELDGILNAGQPSPIYNKARTRAREENGKTGEYASPLDKTESQNKERKNGYSNVEKQNSQQSRKNPREPIISARWILFNGKKLLYVKVDFDNEIYVRQISVDEQPADQQNGKKRNSKIAEPANGMKNGNSGTKNGKMEFMINDWEL